MKIKNLSIILIFFTLVLSIRSAKSETNSSSVTNSVSPSASSTTTGGSSINYQTNQSFSNDVSVGPGIVCRTPSLNIGTSIANTDNTNWASLGNSGTWGNNIAANVGIVIPFGSRVHDSCERIASQISLDKQISTQLSMIRACASLHKEGIFVDIDKFPLLKDCSISLGQPEIVKPKQPKPFEIAERARSKNTKLNLDKKANSSKPKTKIPKLIEPI